MALIKCSECGREISDKATACPACGNPINGGVQAKETVVVIEQTGKTWKGIQLVSGVSIIIGLYMGHFGFGGTPVADVAIIKLANFYLGLGIIGMVIGSLGAWWNHR